MEKTTEELVYDFIKAAVEAVSDAQHPLFGLEVHDHPFRKIRTNRGIRLNPPEGQLSPLEDGLAMGEFNVRMIVVVYVRIEGTHKDDDDRTLAMRQVTDISKALGLLFWDNPTFDEGFRDARLYDFVRGYDSLNKADHFAVANLTLLVNRIGQTIGG
ncbi:MAG TPA: hypothetical protein PLD20_00980 [Blastocatellia bacterium]|nr:hypothetical protein [Blastocatellia bacterium]HMV81821.1 hypothetical protein [Blastocatellia bacterium]HMX23998.1 hypothetical protein [Blastocatellia bacterium]HMY70428.1 hypothetical protein [Blastocatellia bacterium]HMZ16509.1 hypothetical protein [Blastocatellia bacterium]